MRRYPWQVRDSGQLLLLVAAGAGTVMATRGKPAELRVETRITFKLNEPVTVTEKLH